MVNNINAQTWLDEKYPKNGVCERKSDQENKNKKREEIIKLDISKGNLGKHFYKIGEGDKTLIGSLKLTGFTNLQTLICSSHEIVNLDVSECSSLQELDCHGSKLTSLNVTGCSNLEKINCLSNEFLEEIDISKCLKITKVYSDLILDYEEGKLSKKIIEFEDGENAQTWLDKNYSKEKRVKIKELKIEEKNLVGKLDLSEYINLEELYCYHNRLTKIDFANDSFSKLRVLHVGGNDFPEQDLSIFSEFSNLKVLNLGNNNFVDSLKPLKNLKKLLSIDISDTNINEGLEYLPKELESLYCQIEKKENAKCSQIREELKDYCLDDGYSYDYQTWREENEEKLFGRKKNKVSDNVKNERKEKIFQNEPKTRPGKETRNILLIGKTGGGKSNLANVLTNSESFKSSSSSGSVTKKVKIEKIEHKGIKYRIIDTIGLGDTELTNEELLDKFDSEVGNYIQQGINQIFLVVNGRLTEDILTEYHFLSSFLFDRKVTKYSTIVRTNFPEFENEQECENDRKRVRETIEIFVGDNKSVEILYVDNPPLSYGDIAIKKREASRKVLLKYLEQIRDVRYEPMNGEKLQNEFNSLKEHLDDWMSKLDKSEKKLLKKLIEENEEKWVASDGNESIYEVDDKVIINNKDYPQFKEKFLEKKQVNELSEKKIVGLLKKNHRFS